MKNPHRENGRPMVTVAHPKARTYAVLRRLLEGLRIYWVVPVLISAYALLGSPNTEGYIVPALCASVACGLALMSVDYAPLSLVSITVITHAVSYPIACFLNLAEDRTAVYENFLWSATPLAMWACTLGMLGLAAGVWAASVLSRRRQHAIISSHSIGRLVNVPVSSPYVNFAISLVAVPYVIFQIANGFYFHSQVTGVDAYNFHAAADFGFLGYLLMFSYTGVFLQVGRYMRTRTRIDALWVLFLISVYVLLFAPSGSRDATLTVVLVAFFSFMAWEDHWQAKLRVMLAVMIAFIVMTVSLQIYRYVGLANRNTDLVENILVIGDTLSRLSLRDVLFSGESHFIITRRLADYVATGWYISTVPHTAPFRYFENMQYWPALLLPFFLRPAVPPYALQETAALTYESSGYGWHMAGEGSSPAMILGDFYTRFGWPGIFLGMFFLGLILMKFDGYFLKPTVQRKIVFAMFWVIAWKALTQSSMTGLFIFFTRTFFICWLVSHLAYFALGRLWAVKPMRRSHERNSM